MPAGKGRWGTRAKAGHFGQRGFNKNGAGGVGGGAK